MKTSGLSFSVCRIVSVCLAAGAFSASAASSLSIPEEKDLMRFSTATLDFAVRTKGYVTGIAAGSMIDKKTGFHDAGFGLDIVDWIMEPGSDEAYRDKLTGDLPYKFNNEYHGKTAKRCVEGPQICTQANELTPQVIRGKDFIAITQQFKYKTAAPGKNIGSTWTQTIVFPAGQRYFISSDRMTCVNSGDELFFRLDMPGHIRHTKGDTFSEVYLSYYGKIQPSEFFENFAPDAKFNYRRDKDKMPQRFIRAYHLRDPKTGAPGPWLAGMTLKPSDVYEAWCHQRNYVCLIEEIGGHPVKAGETFGAAYIVGYFDSIEEMEKVYDQYAGHSTLDVSETGWQLGGK